MRRERPSWKISIAAIALAVVAASAVPVAAQDPPPPRAFGALLRAQSEWRLLDPAIDLAGDYTVDQLKELDRWPPWLEQDFDRDGNDDVAAVVVRRGAKGQSEFTVVVVHSTAPGRATLVVPFSPQRIFGVSEGIADDTVTPLRCADCDANLWYRWNGRGYEALLHAAGEPLLLGGEPGRPLALFTDPSATASRVTEVPGCVRARVLEVGGEDGQRWYRVEALVATLARGWVPQQYVVQRIECKE
jgi:hypothetical protein